MLCQHVSPYFQTILTYLKLSTLLYNFQVSLQGQILHNAWGPYFKRYELSILQPSAKLHPLPTKVNLIA
jgi:hypothetical protein